jgi:prefoldin subunit 5
MDLLERMQKEVRNLDNQINKLEQEAEAKKRHKKSLEKALKELVPLNSSQTVSQVK